MSSTDTLTRQMHESRARRLIAAETRAAAAEAIRKDLESVWVAFGIVAFIVLGYALALWLGGRQ